MNKNGSINYASSMPRYLTVLALAFGFLLSAGFTGVVNAQTWELVWQDEFDTDGMLDPAIWNYTVGGSGFGNNELQYYTDARPENARIEDGIFIIEAHKEDLNGSSYSSARVNTKGKRDLTYGRVEVMAKLPSGRGTWPAIWMLYTDRQYGGGGWPDNGEIDIMEHVGFDQGRIHSTVHTKAFNHKLGTQVGASTFRNDVSTAFHLYAIEWTPLEIRGYIDDEHYFTFEKRSDDWEEWPFNQDHHLIMNIAVGGDWGGAQGIDDSVFPQRMEIDFVRVYEQANAEPELNLESPTADTTFAPGDTLFVSATATDASGSITQVDIFQGGGIIASLTQEPYTYQIEDLAPGCYSLSVRASDDEGWTTTSDTLAITVGTDCSRAPFIMRYHDVPGLIEAEFFDIGGPGVAYADVDAGNRGNGIRQDEGVDIDITNDFEGRYHVTDMSVREWLEYTVDVETTGLYDLVLRYASEFGSSFRLDVDGVDATGTVEIERSGGPISWVSRPFEVTLESGIHTLRFNARSGGMKLNSLEFYLRSPTSVETFSGVGSFAINAVFPNPMSENGIIQVETSIAEQLDIDIYDVRGRVVQSISDAVIAPGVHEFSVDGTRLASGVYLVRVEGEQSAANRRFTIIQE